MNLLDLEAVAGIQIHANDLQKFASNIGKHCDAGKATNVPFSGVSFEQSFGSHTVYLSGRLVAPYLKLIRVARIFCGVHFFPSKT